jgi:predicted nucleic acid-binding protein
VTTAVDTNVLLDVLIPNTRQVAASKERLDQCLTEGALVVSEPVYAELAARFPTGEELDKFLLDTSITLVRSSLAALRRASEAWKAYAQTRDPNSLQCPRCGTSHSVTCRSCGATLRSRQHILTDFLVGGHALVHADRLLTRDLGYYGTYFQDLRTISP